jgi:hypothetical protein
LSLTSGPVAIIVDLTSCWVAYCQTRDDEIHAVTTDCDRLALLARLLDPEDYRFIETRNPAIAKRFRSQRMRIFRTEWWAIANNIGPTFRAGASRIDAAGYWRAYPSLLHRTALICCAIAKLRFACMLFSWHLPVLIDVRATTNRLVRYATAGTLSVAPSHSPG